jgi:hypothetical protein
VQLAALVLVEPSERVARVAELGANALVDAPPAQPGARLAAMSSDRRACPNTRAKLLNNRRFEQS